MEIRKRLKTVSPTNIFEKELEEELLSAWQELSDMLNNGLLPKAHIGGSENYISIDENGNLAMNGDATVWDDLRIVPGAFTFAGSADPSLQDWQPGGSGATLKVWRFKKDDEAFASCQMPHSYKEGTDLNFHIHWTPADRGNEENGALVGWKVDYTIANVGGVNFGSTTTVDLSDACSGFDDRHEKTIGVSVDGTGLLISHMILLRIYRSDTGADDTWAGTLSAQSPGLLEFDIHFEMDTIGSKQVRTK